MASHEVVAMDARPGARDRSLGQPVPLGPKPDRRVPTDALTVVPASVAKPAPQVRIPPTASSAPIRAHSSGGIAALHLVVRDGRADATMRETRLEASQGLIRDPQSRGSVPPSIDLRPHQRGGPAAKVPDLRAAMQPHPVDLNPVLPQTFAAPIEHPPLGGHTWRFPAMTRVDRRKAAFPTRPRRFSLARPAPRMGPPKKILGCDPTRPMRRQTPLSLPPSSRCDRLSFHFCPSETSAASMSAWCASAAPRCHANTSAAATALPSASGSWSTHSVAPALARSCWRPVASLFWPHRDVRCAAPAPKKSPSGIASPTRSKTHIVTAKIVCARVSFP